MNALYAAIGSSQRVISPDDIFIHKDEHSAPKDRQVVIDILIRPTNAQNHIIDDFPTGSPWLELWGTGIVLDENDNHLVAIRTSFKWNDIKSEYITERRFLKDWQKDGNKWELSKPIDGMGHVTAQQIQPMCLFFLDAQRDIVDDLRNRSSFWNRLVDDHGLAKEDVTRIESTLSTINQDIVQGSKVFTHIQEHLENFEKTLSCDKRSIAITPITRHLRDLSKGMDVVLSTKDAPTFSLRQQGMGTRSLGTFFTFCAFSTWRQLQGRGEALHPMAALEEPEAHLHPQAQKALFLHIGNLPGQRIISTHSPYICSETSITQMRHFSKTGEETRVSAIDIGTGPDRLSNEDLRKIDRQVMNTRGDLLFAKVVVFFEGETEEQALPDFAEQYWKQHPNNLGCSFVSVSGSGNYLPFLRMAQGFSIPWFIFSDGEPQTITTVNIALQKLGLPLIPDNDRVLTIPDGKNFEQLIADEHNANLLYEQHLNEVENEHERKAKREKWAKTSPADKILHTVSMLEKNKTLYGNIVGKILPPPKLVGDLLLKLDTTLGRTIGNTK